MTCTDTHQDQLIRETQARAITPYRATTSQKAQQTRADTDNSDMIATRLQPSSATAGARGLCASQPEVGLLSPATGLRLHGVAAEFPS